MRRPTTPRRSSMSDRRDARRFTLIVALIALATAILLVALIAPGAIPLPVVWPPVIALVTGAVRLYLRPRR